MIRTSQRYTPAAATTAGSDHSAARRSAPLPQPATRRTPSCEYRAPASLFVRSSTGRLRYQSFDRASLAVQYANEQLTSNQLLSCVIEVDNVRFDGGQVRELYLSVDYPHDRSSA